MTPAQAKRKPVAPARSRRRLPEEMACDAIAHEEPAPGDNDQVRMTFRVVLSRNEVIRLILLR